MQKTYKDYLFVGIQGVLFLLFLILPQWRPVLFSDWLRYAGLGMAVIAGLVVVLALLNLGESLTVYPTPKSGSHLKTHGLYQLARHPIYSGIIYGGLGWGAFQQNLGQITVALGLWILFYFKSRYEEAGLEQKYGEDYQQYKKKVGRFFPKWK